MKTALLIAIVLAGCAMPMRPEGDAAPSFLLSRVADSGSEPTVGVTSDGAIFVGGGRTPSDGRPGSGNVGREAVYRSADAGATWIDVLESAGAARAPADFDPWMWVDPTTDRVFDAPLYVGCSWIAWTDDRGASWENNAAGGCGTPGHDHQHLSTGPPARGVTTDGYPNVVYYSYHSLAPGTTPVLNATNPVFGSNLYEGPAVSVSIDGGRTFAPRVLVREQDPCVGGNTGAVAVAPDGTAYLGMPTCTGVDVSVSRDSGASWETPVAIDGAGMQLGLAMDPSIGVDAAGNAYVAWAGADNGFYLSKSIDAGRTWSRPTRIDTPPVRATVFGVLVAGEAGRVAVAYLGTASEPSTWPSPDPSDAPDDAVWHLYVAWSNDALAPVPTFSTAQATPTDDPVQRGCIWLRGGTEACRNLGDFIGMSWLRDGRVVVSFADGCDACASAQESHLSNVFVAIERSR